MALDLLTLEPQKINRSLEGKFTLLYGNAKVGKTTLASEIDKVLIAAFELGANALHGVLVSPMKKWQDWRDTVKQLVKDREKLKDKIGIIAIDTVDEAYKLCEKYICNKEGIQNIKEIPYGGGYKMLDDEFMSGFRDLAYAGYGLFFISHSTTKTFKDDNGNEYEQIVPALPNRPYNLINKMVDNIVYLRQIPIQEGDRIVQKRYLFFRGDDRFLAGSRLHYIVPRTELSYENLVNAISDAVEEEIKHKGIESDNTVNPYTEVSFDDLMEEARAIWIKVNQVEKQNEAMHILEEEFGKPTRFSEILPDQKDKLNRALTEIKTLI